MQSFIAQKQNELRKLCAQYQVHKLELFGSATTDSFDPKRSDLDFLVTFTDSVQENRFGIFFSLRQALSELFNRPVDLVEPGGLKNPYLINQINQTRELIYAQS